MGLKKSLAFKGDWDPDGKRWYFPKRMRDRAVEVFEGYDVMLVWKKFYIAKTPKQLRYYHGVVVFIWMYEMIKAGNDFDMESKEDFDMVNQFLKDNYLRNGFEYVDKSTGEVKMGPSSLSDNVSTDDVIRFVERVDDAFLANFGYRMPEPDSDWRSKDGGKSLKARLIESLDDGEEVIKCEGCGKEVKVKIGARYRLCKKCII